MKKPMTDFITRGGLGELLAAATQAIETLLDDTDFFEPEVAAERLQLAVDDGIKAREEEAKARASRTLCASCCKPYLALDTGPRSVGYCSDNCAPAEDIPRGGWCDG